MLYFCWGCRGNYTLIIERDKEKNYNNLASLIWIEAIQNDTHIMKITLHIEFQTETPSWKSNKVNPGKELDWRRCRLGLDVLRCLGLSLVIPIKWQIVIFILVVETRAPFFKEAGFLAKIVSTNYAKKKLEAVDQCCRRNNQSEGGIYIPSFCFHQCDCYQTQTSQTSSEVVECVSFERGALKFLRQITFGWENRKVRSARNNAHDESHVGSLGFLVHDKWPWRMNNHSDGRQDKTRPNGHARPSLFSEPFIGFIFRVEPPQDRGGR